MIKYLTIYKRLRSKVHNLEIQNSAFQEVIENARQYAEELKAENKALKDELKAIKAEPVAEWQKTLIEILNKM